MERDPAVDTFLTVLRLRDLNSIDIAESTRIVHEILGDQWVVDEVDDDDEHHLSWEMVTVGAALVQCALAGVAVWLQAQGNRRNARAQDIDAEVARIAKSLGVPAGDAEEVATAISTSTDKIVLQLPDYELRVRRSRRFEYVVSGRRRGKK